MTVPDPRWLAPTYFVDCDHPDIVARAKAIVGDETVPWRRASLLFRAVRDTPRYDPYTFTVERDAYRASRIVHAERAFCVPKAILLAALARASGIPTRLGFADVRNHLSSEKLLRTLGTDVFAWHGYVELWVDGVPRKASPAFNAELCAKFGVPPLELGEHGDALLAAFDGAGTRFMEYLRDRGLHEDLPFDAMLASFAELYGIRGDVRAPREEDDAFETS